MHAHGCYKLILL